MMIAKAHRDDRGAGRSLGLRRRTACFARGLTTGQLAANAPARAGDLSRCFGVWRPGPLGVP